MLFPAGKSFFEAQSFDVFVEKVFQAEHRVQTIEGEPQRLPLGRDQGRHVTLSAREYFAGYPVKLPPTENPFEKTQGIFALLCKREYRSWHAPVRPPQHQTPVC